MEEGHTILEILHRHGERRVCGWLYMEMDWPSEKGLAVKHCEKCSNDWLIHFGSRQLLRVKRAIVMKKSLPPDPHPLENNHD